MPDAFGNKTPQEVLAGFREENFRRNQLANQSGSTGAQAGQALANIFAPTINKTIDTRAARAAEATRLQKTLGYSKEQADAEARQTIGRDRTEVRQAKSIQEAGSEMQQFMDGLPAAIPSDMRQAQGMLFMSNRLRSLGLTVQANNMAAQASAAITAAEDRALKIKDLKASIRSKDTASEIREAELPFVGATTFLQNVMKKEQIIAQLQDPSSQLEPGEREALMRSKGHLEAKILKDETITGRTAEDVRGDPVLQRKLFLDISDKEVLLANLAEADVALAGLDDFDASVWANYQKDALAFMENWLGRTPDESEREFMDRIIEKQGKPSIIAAKIRHSLTGAQMSAFEIQYLTPFLPSPTDSVQQMRSKMRVVRDYTQLDRDTRLEMFRQGLTIPMLNRNMQSGAGSFDAPLESGETVTPAAIDAAGDYTQSIMDAANSTSN